MEGGREEGETLQSDALVNMDQIVEDEEIRPLLIPDVKDLPSIPPSAVESNFVRYYAAAVVMFKYIILVTDFCRCCVKGSLLEVNDRLLKQPELLNSSVSMSSPFPHEDIA
ncbi:hypothetical protein GW17_00027472 [Ensete ventricosum]|nr:hypothetical protein GW17_00027472 [Ensete ventricosum]